MSRTIQDGLSSGSRRPWRSANFRRYYAGQATSYLGDGMVPVVYAFAALEVTHSGWAMPAILLGLWSARVLLMSRGGVAADRANRATIMLCSDVVRLVAQAAVALLFLTGSIQMWHLVASAVLYGGATAYFVPASIGVLPRILPAEQLQQANASLGVARNIGLLVGPGLGSLLYSLGGIQLALGFDVLTFVVSIVTLAILVSAVRWTHAPAGTEPGDGGGGTDDSVRVVHWFRVLARVPIVMWVVVIWCPVQIAVASVNVVGPLVARDDLGDVTTWSVLATGMAVGGLSGAALAGVLTVRRPVATIVALLGALMPLQLAGMALVPHVAPLFVLFALTSVALAVCGVLFDTYLQREIDGTMLGRVSSAESGVTSAMVPVGLAVSLPVAQLVGTDTYLLGIACVIVSIAVVGAVMIRAHASRDSRSTDQQPSEVNRT